MQDQAKAPEVVEPLDIDVLINYHKMEASEEMTYMTILISVIIVLIGYLGTAPRVRRGARILMLVIYSVLHYSLVTPFMGSMRFHNALHVEIRTYAEKLCPDPKAHQCSELYKEILNHMKPKEAVRYQVGWWLLYSLVFLSLLSIGNDPLLRSDRLDSILNWIWKFFGNDPPKQQEQQD